MARNPRPHDYHDDNDYWDYLMDYVPDENPDADELERLMDECDELVRQQRRFDELNKLLGINKIKKTKNNPRLE